MIYRHPDYPKNTHTEERDERDLELEFYGWTTENGPAKGDDESAGGGESPSAGGKFAGGGAEGGTAADGAAAEQAAENGDGPAKRSGNRIARTR